MKYIRSCFALIFILLIIHPCVKAQKGLFQSFQSYNIAVTCPCELKASDRIKRMAAFTGTTELVSGYDCTTGVGNNEINYSLTITDYRKRYNVLPLATYTKAVEKELERLTLNFAKSGSMVRWSRIQGVYGVQTNSRFESITTQTVYLIKEGVQYELQVQGRGNYYDEFVEFVDSLRTL